MIRLYLLALLCGLLLAGAIALTERSGRFMLLPPTLGERLPW